MPKTGYFEIKDKIMYHTSNSTKYKVGDVVTCGKENNGMHFSVFEKEYTVDGKSIYGSDGYIEKLKERKLVKAKRVNDLKFVICDYDFTLREIALEEVRKNEFKKYPSRLKSMFVCDCLEDALVWKPKMSWRRTGCQFVTFKCSGKLFIGDSRVNRTNNLSFGELLKRAQKYWNGEVTENPRFECLFEGKAEVIAVEEIK